MKLFLIQHAQAKSKEEDPQRSLTDEGKANIKKVAEYVARTAPEVTEVWHSEKLRAKQTAQILAESTRVEFHSRKTSHRNQNASIASSFSINTWQ